MSCSESYLKPFQKSQNAQLTVRLMWKNGSTKCAIVKYCQIREKQGSNHDESHMFQKSYRKSFNVFSAKLEIKENIVLNWPQFATIAKAFKNSSWLQISKTF